MPKIPETDIQTIKQSTDLVSLCRSRGIKLKKLGKNYKGQCPFHDEENASFTVNPAKNLWNCFGCGAGGDVIDLVMKLDNLTFPKAAAQLLPIATNPATKKKRNPSLSSRDRCLSTLERSRILSLIADFYHAAFNQQKAGKDYLKQRGITDPVLFSRFKAGFCAGNLRESMPRDGEMLENLKNLGVINGSGGEFFKNCVVLPIPDASGRIVNLYGRRIRNSQVNHLYLPGTKQGIFNAAALKTADQIILVESILDALAVVQAGFSGAIPCFGSAGVPGDVLDLLKKYPAKSVCMCFDGDDAGRKAASKSREQLEAMGINARQIQLPDGHDPCALLQEKNGKVTFKQLMRKAGGTLLMGSSKEIKPTKIQWNNGKAVFSFPERIYELKGICKDPSKCKITIKVKPSNGNPGMFLDTVDFYSARSRSVFARSVAEMFGSKDALVAAELLSMIEPIDQYKEDKTKEPDLDGKPEMTEAEKQEALSFLTAPDIFDQLLKDFETTGYTGETTNKLIGYLAAISRKLDEPISICIQSQSAAGKSALQDAILRLVPDEDKESYTRLTGQALFYKAQDSLKHKILAIEEDVGAREANYSLRAMQSSKVITIASAGRDPQTGKLRTEENRVEGPVVIFITTTEPDMDGETASRFIFLTIDESREATEQIHMAQRAMKTLEGLVMRKKTDKIIRKHQNAQRLLEDGLQVVIPFSNHLQFKTDNIRTRRDHEKYLSLIMVIAYLHQYQRQVKIKKVDGEPVRYVEAKLDDVRMANHLASEVMGASLDELAPPSRRLLGLIREMVTAKAEEQSIDPKDYAFTRRDIRDYTGWSDMQVKRYIHQLEDLEYIHSTTGSKGKQYVYELRYEDTMEPGKKFLSCLVNVDDLAKKLKESGADANLVT